MKAVQKISLNISKFGYYERHPLMHADLFMKNKDESSRVSRRWRRWRMQRPRRTPGARERFHDFSSSEPLVKMDQNFQRSNSSLIIRLQRESILHQRELIGRNRRRDLIVNNRYLLTKPRGPMKLGFLLLSTVQNKGLQATEGMGFYNLGKSIVLIISILSMLRIQLIVPFVVNQTCVDTFSASELHDMWKSSCLMLTSRLVLTVFQPSEWNIIGCEARWTKKFSQ